MRWFVPSVVALTFISSIAVADPDKGGPKGPPGRGEQADKGPDKGDAKRGEADKDGNKNPGKEATKPADDDDEEEADAGSVHAGHPAVVKGRRTPAQMNFRREHWDKSAKSLEAVVHKGNKRITAEEREVIHRHDRHTMRLLRIRELAEEEKAEAIVKRVDAALERLDKNAQTKLEKLNESAPGGAK